MIPRTDLRGKIMKTLKFFLFFYICVKILSSCSPSVHVDQDDSVSMANFRTYKFVDNDHTGDPNPLYHSSLLDNAIHAEIARQLEKRGMREDVTSPDVLIAYHTYTEKKQSSINNYYPMMYGGWGWQYYPWGGGFSPYPFGYWNGYARTYTYTEGTLIVDVINAQSNVLVWRGSVSDAITDPSNLHRKGIQAVDDIFKKFPLKFVAPGQPPVASSRYRNNN
jgi:hypothetical protein